MSSAWLKGLARLLLAGILAAVSWAAQAEERIHDYEVDIRLTQAGRLIVTENLLLTAEGGRIVHGIERGIPLVVGGEEGLRARSALTVLGVERDGQPEPYVTQGNSQGEVIRIGDDGVELAPGQYRYTIRYELDRVVDHLDEHDRLVWNVNGTDGRFVIDALTTQVVLPEGVTPLSTRVYTGSLGEVGKDASVAVSRRAIRFVASRPFDVGENMTIDLTLPKGSIQAPDEQQRRDWWFRDYGSIVYGTALSVAGSGLAWLLWFLFGRDRRPGVVVPRWDPPGGMSPGQVNYLMSRNFEDGYWRALSASILDLAVKGRVVLETWADGLAVRKTTDEPAEDLPAGQAAILQSLPAPGTTFYFRQADAERVAALGAAFSEAVVSEVGETLYQPQRWIWLSFALLAVLSWLIYDHCFTTGWEYVDGWYFPLHLVLAAAAWIFCFRAVQQCRALSFMSWPADNRARIRIAANLLFAAALMWLLLDVLYAYEPTLRDSILVGTVLFLCSLLLWLAVGRTSAEGRVLLDGIAGLSLYLRLTEKDRRIWGDLPPMSPTHYETLLPYAVALGVESAWSQRFETALAAAEAAGTDWRYEPAWYAHIGVGNVGQVANVQSFLTSMTAGIEASMAQDSSTSDGSGWSGSGRGGGGVGGW